MTKESTESSQDRDKNHWIKSAAERKERYEEARQMLLRHAADRGGRADLMPVLTQQTVKRIIDGDNVGPTNQERLIYMMGLGPSTSIYRGTAALINQKPEEKRPLAALNGKYRYYRYDTPTSYSQIALRPGSFEIFTEKSSRDPTFHHRSHNWHEEHPEHSGFVFQTGGRIFLLGRGRSMLRLAICRERPDMDGVVLDGLILSLRSSDRIAFAARFIMLREEAANSKLLAALDNEKTRVTTFERLTDGHKVWFIHA